MRFGGPLAAVTLLLCVGCTQPAQPARISPVEPPPTVSSTAMPTPTAVAPPESAAAVSDVIRWIEDGDPVDTAGYHTALQSRAPGQLDRGLGPGPGPGEGVPQDLGDDIAFTTSSGTSCMTESQYGDGALACLVDLSEPPQPPAQVYGQWIGGWVDYDGAQLTVGSVHADPGRFLVGQGPALPDGDSLRFGDYHCRSDQEALYCVHYARQSAVKFSAAGIEPFGCLAPVAPAPDAGRQFSC